MDLLAAVGARAEDDLLALLELELGHLAGAGSAAAAAWASGSARASAPASRSRRRPAPASRWRVGVAVAAAFGRRLLVVAAGRAEDDHGDDGDDDRDREEGEALGSRHARSNIAGCSSATRRPRDRPARPRLGVGPARTRLGERGVPGARAARAGVPRGRAARRRLAGRGPGAAARRGRAAAARSSPTRGPSTSRSGAAPRAGSWRRAATPRCSSPCTAPRSTTGSSTRDALPARGRGADPRATCATSARCRSELAAGLDPGRGRAQPAADRGARRALARALPRPGRDARRRAGRRRAGRAARRAGRGRGPAAAAGCATTRPCRRGPRPRRSPSRPGRSPRAAVAVGCEARRLEPGGALGAWVALRFAARARIRAQPELIPSTSSRPPKERGSTPCSRS